MTAPEPAAVPTELWWSPSLDAASGWGLCWSRQAGEYVRPRRLPADAVRLVPDPGRGMDGQCQESAHPGPSMSHNSGMTDTVQAQENPGG